MAFADLRGVLTAAPVLVPSDWSKQFRCHVDASQRTVEGTLTQVDDKGQDWVIAYYSRELSDSKEKRYGQRKGVFGSGISSQAVPLLTLGGFCRSFHRQPNLTQFHDQTKIVSQRNKMVSAFLSVWDHEDEPFARQDTCDRRPHVMSGAFQIGNFEVSEA